MPYFKCSKAFINQYFILSLLLVLSKLQNSTININLEDMEQKYQSSSYFKITPKETIPNNIKIEVFGNDTDNIYLLSYYKNDNLFKERNQLAKSLSGNAFMWLNNAQIKNEFYLSVECSNSKNCEFSLKITKKDNIEINIGESYSYYVTEDNKDITFNITGNPFLYPYLYKRGDCKISLWAKGNKNIITNLTNVKYYKHSQFNSFLINFGNAKNFTYSFNVKGEIGDLINIGVLFFDGNNICINPIKSFGYEISALLVKETMDNCYFILNTNLTQKFFYYNYDFEDSQFLDNEHFSNLNNTQIFIILDPNEKEQFFSLRYLENNDANNKNNKIYHFPPQELGRTYATNIKKDEFISLIPMKPEDNFKYLTYHVAEKEGMFKAYIYKCENYPLCELNSDTLKNSTQLIDINSATISYNNSEYDKGISPISKNQDILLLTCETDNCLLFTSMYTEKNTLNIVPSIPYYKYIRTDNENNYVIYLNKILSNYMSIVPENLYIYINLEILSGDIQIKVKGNVEVQSNGEKKLYIIKAENISEFSLNIKAYTDSIYTIVSSLHTDKNDLLTSQMNYLLKSAKGNDYNNLIFSAESQNNSPFYLGFFSLNCKMEISKTNENNIKSGESFYQDYQIIDEKTKAVQYKATRSNKEDDNCLYGTSMFRLYNQKNELNNIFLENNDVYPFILYQKYNKIKYSYIYAVKDIDININLKSNDEANISATLILKEGEQKIYNLTKSESINVNSSDIKNICTDDRQPCKINLILEAQNAEKDSSVQVSFNQNIPKKKEEDVPSSDTDDNNLFLILGIVGGVVLLLIIIIAIFIIIRKKKSNSDSYERITGETDKQLNGEMPLLEENK